MSFDGLASVDFISSHTFFPATEADGMPPLKNLTCSAKIVYILVKGL